MTYESLIVAVADAAPDLSHTGLRVLLQLIALSIEQGTNEVQAAHRSLAEKVKLSKEGIAIGIRNLAHIVTVDVRPGRVATFTLPADWFDTQRPIIASPDERQNIHSRPGNQDSERPGNQDSSVLETRTVVSWKPGQLSYKPGQLSPGNQDSYVEKRLTRPGFQDSCSDSPIRNAPARVDRSIERVYSGIEALVVIDRAFHSVEIQPDHQEAAEIVADALRICRLNFDSDAYASSHPDRKVVARILAIAPVDQLCYVLRTIAEKRTRPGDSDMWFFSVLLHRIHSIPAPVTAARIKQLSAKAQSLNGKPTLFQDQLLQETAARARKLA